MVVTNYFKVIFDEEGKEQAERITEKEYYNSTGDKSGRTFGYINEYRLLLFRGNDIISIERTTLCDIQSLDNKNSSEEKKQ